MAENVKRADFDAVVIGAGFAGLYMLHRLRDELGMSTQVFEAGDGVGGTWYWNRYPGARCDSESYIYCYSFSKELLQEWNWSGKYPEQPEILAYLNHVADRFDLRRDVQFNTRVTAASFREADGLWEIETDQGDRVTARYLITAIGCISAGQVPDIAGLDSFEGEWYHTGGWPHEGVEFAGKRVGVIGTGSSGVQSIPVIARQAGHVTVFQRTPQYTVPARHENVDRKFLEDVKANYDAIWEKARTRPAVCRCTTRSAPPLRQARKNARQRTRPAGLRGPWLPLRFLPRHQHRPAGERHGGGVHPGPDPRDRDRPGDRREATSPGPPPRVETSADRHQLLRHVQPRQRQAR